MCANVASDACTVLALRSGPLLGHCDSLSLYSPRPSPLVRWQHQQQQNTPFGAVSPTLNQQSGSNLFGNSPANVCLRECICCLIQCLTEWVGGRSHTFVYLGMDIYMDEYMRIRNHVFSTHFFSFHLTHHTIYPQHHEYPHANTHSRSPQYSREATRLDLMACNSNSISNSNSNSNSNSRPHRLSSEQAGRQSRHPLPSRSSLHSAALG